MFRTPNVLTVKYTNVINNAVGSLIQENIFLYMQKTVVATGCMDATTVLPTHVVTQLHQKIQALKHSHLVVLRDSTVAQSFMFNMYVI